MGNANEDEKMQQFFCFLLESVTLGGAIGPLSNQFGRFLHYYSGNSGKDFVTLHIYVGIQLVSTHFVPADGVSVLGNDKIILYD